MTSSMVVNSGPGGFRHQHDATIHRGLFRGMRDARILRCHLGLCVANQKHNLCKHCRTLPYVALPLQQVFVLRDIPRRWSRPVPGAYPTTRFGNTDLIPKPPLDEHDTASAGSSQELVTRIIPEVAAANLRNDENEGLETGVPEIAPMHPQPKIRGWERIGKRVRKIVY